MGFRVQFSVLHEFQVLNLKFPNSINTFPNSQSWFFFFIPNILYWLVCILQVILFCKDRICCPQHWSSTIFNLFQLNAILEIGTLKCVFQNSSLGIVPYSDFLSALRGLNILPGYWECLSFFLLDIASRFSEPLKPFVNIDMMRFYVILLW